MIICLCTLDEFMEGHRHHCPDHIPCPDCENEVCGEVASTLITFDKDEPSYTGFTACVQEPGHCGPHVGMVSWGGGKGDE